MTRADVIKELKKQHAENIKAGNYWIQKRFTTGAYFFEKARGIEKTILMLMGE